MFSIKPQVPDLSRGANVQMLCKGDFPLGGGFTLTVNREDGKKSKNTVNVTMRWS